MLTVNIGVMGSTDILSVDTKAEVVAPAGGTGIETLRKINDRGNIVTVTGVDFNNAFFYSSQYNMGLSVGVELAVKHAEIEDEGHIQK